MEDEGGLTDNEGVFREFFVEAFGSTAVEKEVKALRWGDEH